ncbi:4Fe-4S binding protein [Prosthecochloris sp. N3]|uniref:4Fe-4S binding protein n=1 Tax=Prosthecochloris ethylica TaxID=2743976 RepID=A0ABR9XPV7_9CHLB|nr:4Fe-4S binding protein [Prosthecochloris ethylica]MBF0587141.1 4Fe-4S binding protein [Prosthecochloris ethylica]MBF0636009.1 4Fe-4S binding protein [Prosthecochloris ethylica]NUK48361.1 4Fe-4S binding protein [Prosthecochloris ethylica]
MKRTIVSIDEQLCTGCGECIPGCPEGALQVIDGKARLVSDLFCDGLGACIRTCPYGAISVEEREAEPYDERRVMEESIIPAGINVIAAHLEHLRSHGQTGYLAVAMECLKERNIAVPEQAGTAEESKRPASGGCLGSAAQQFGNGEPAGRSVKPASPAPSRLTHWPVQLHLVTPLAPCYRESDLLLAADCAAFAVGDFHERFMASRTLAIACPKLDSGIDRYIDKLAAMIDMARIRSVTVAIMEVPCCSGLMTIVEQALAKASRSVPVRRIVISVQGDVLEEETADSGSASECGCCRC